MRNFQHIWQNFFFKGGAKEIEEAMANIQSLAKIDISSLEPFLSSKITKDFQAVQVGCF